MILESKDAFREKGVLTFYLPKKTVGYLSYFQ